MHVTKELIAWFEDDQQTYGTDVALHNLLWLQAAAQLKELGITGVSTRMRPAPKPPRRLQAVER